jgi:hypothetical protein
MDDVLRKVFGSLAAPAFTFGLFFMVRWPKETIAYEGAGLVGMALVTMGVIIMRQGRQIDELRRQMEEIRQSEDDVE